MRIQSKTNTNNPCGKFPDNKSLFDGLARCDNDAISCLMEKGRGTIFSYGKARAVSDLDLEEIVEDAAVIFLEKIRTGAYEFQGLAPVTYMVEVGKRLVLKRGERKTPTTVEVNDLQIGGDDEINDFYDQKAMEDLVAKMLEKVGENCRHVIRLRYFEKLSDAEIIDKKLSPYSTVGSLKVKRSECISKLSELMVDKKHLIYGQ
jgi:DNA-directed RNA polymerase specialized sigma24 family protein